MALLHVTLTFARGFGVGAVVTLVLCPARTCTARPLTFTARRSAMASS